MPATSAAYVLLSKFWELGFGCWTLCKRGDSLSSRVHIQPHRLELPVFVSTDICPDFPLSPSIRVSSSVKLCAGTELIMDGCFALDLFNEVLMADRKVQGEILCGCKSQHLDCLELTPEGLKHFTPTGDLSLSSFHWAGEGQSHPSTRH